MKNHVKDYYKWLLSKVCYGTYSSYNDIYSQLLWYLHTRAYTYRIPMDDNRYCDGLDLRYRFGYETKLPYDEVVHFSGTKPCSVLEMMIAIAIRCEEEIMSDDTYGDRTGLWFWSMVSNLGLDDQTDERYDKYKTERTIDIFLEGEYQANGKGGLFYVPKTSIDLRKMDLWYQLNCYLNTL